MAGEKFKLKPLPPDAGPEVAYIEWVDSWSVHGWEFPDRINPEALAVICTIGFVLREDDDGIHLTGSRHKDGKGSVHGHIAIPKCAIKKRVRIV